MLCFYTLKGQRRLPVLLIESDRNAWHTHRFKQNSLTKRWRTSEPSVIQSIRVHECAIWVIDMYSLPIFVTSCLPSFLSAWLDGDRLTLEKNGEGKRTHRDTSKSPLTVKWIISSKDAWATSSLQREANKFCLRPTLLFTVKEFSFLLIVSLERRLIRVCFKFKNVRSSRINFPFLVFRFTFLLFLWYFFHACWY